jgi:plasmid stability protein
MSIIVTGLMRSGTSLMMQVLDKTGFECLGEYPHFEASETAEDAISPNFVQDSVGKAWKWLQPHMHPVESLPEGSVVIIMTRKLEEQAKSWAKIMKPMHGWSTAKEREAKKILVEKIRTEYVQMAKELQKHDATILEVRFEDLIRNPKKVQKTLADVGVHINTRGVVKNRSPKCFKGIMEQSMYK